MDFTPIFGTKKGLGLYEDDIAKLKAKPGDWVGIEYNGKTTSTYLREIPRYPELNWKDNVAWIHPDDAKELDLKGIGDSPIKPILGFSIKVHRHSLPRSKLLYLAIATFITGAIATVLGILVQGKLVPEAYIFPLGMVWLAFTLTASALGLITTVAQKQ